jgi:signal transduction histidine kinase
MASSKRLKMLIEDLLTLSRVNNSGKSFVPVDLAELTRGVIGDLETRIEETAGEVDVAPLARIEGDPIQLRQLLQNLIGNALKFHREGIPPRVKVYGRFMSNGISQKKSRPLYELSVEDKGIGFEEQYIEKLFEPFQRLHSRNKFEGTGIGTAICKKIALRHGGSITARSTLEEGSTFVVVLPVVQ